ncbi:MAG: DUF87 domain-containing protein [Planctomycetota bacterium]
MPLAHFSVSQVRVAATCPRVFYFDSTKTGGGSSTLVWVRGARNATAAGQLFHHAIEAFNGQVLKDDAVKEMLLKAPSSEELQTQLLSHVYSRFVNRDALLKKTGDEQSRFMAALRGYVGELAEVLFFAVGEKRPAHEILDEVFGDRRRRVDVTFYVGPENQPIHVSGVLDYVFHDWRSGRNRILDYKLNGGEFESRDLLQVSVYGLMHDIQHQTHPDVGVLYLSPRRSMKGKAWESVYADRGIVYDLLASMVQWAEYDPETKRGLKPPGSPEYCDGCKWNNKGQCEKLLGPKTDGDRIRQWEHRSLADLTQEPVLEIQDGADSANERQAKQVAVTPRKEAARRVTVSVPESEQKRDNDSIVVSSGKSGLVLGRAESGMPVVLQPNLLTMHLAVVGAAGSGKTWIAKVIAEEAIRNQIPVLAIDPQGDLVQFIERRDPAEIPKEEREAYREFGNRVETRIFTPGTSHARRLSLSPIRVLREDELKAIPDPARREEERMASLSALASSLVSLAKMGGEVDSQETFVKTLVRAMTSQGQNAELKLSDIAAAVKSPDTLGIDDPDQFIKKSEREKLARKLNNLLHGPASALYSGGEILDLDRFTRTTRAGKVPLNVIYLNAMHSDEQKYFFLASLAEEIYRWMISRTSAGNSARLLFYIDEARDFVPATGKVPPTRRPLLRLLTQGRKFGVSCLFCTQSPRSLDYNVFGNCSTKIIGRLEAAQDVDRVKEWFANAGEGIPSWLEGRRGAEKGTFVGRWPEMPVELQGATFKSRMLFSRHEGAWSPERLEQALGKAQAES